MIVCLVNALEYVEQRDVRIVVAYSLAAGKIKEGIYIILMVVVVVPAPPSPSNSILAIKL